MIKTKSPEEWVEAAFAAGAAPCFMQGVFDLEGRMIDPVWWLCTNEYGVNRKIYPDRFPDEWWDEIFQILSNMGRCHPAEEDEAA
jgi:hypothetical protein